MPLADEEEESSTAPGGRPSHVLMSVSTWDGRPPGAMLHASTVAGRLTGSSGVGYEPGQDSPGLRQQDLPSCETEGRRDSLMDGRPGYACRERGSHAEVRSSTAGAHRGRGAGAAAHH